MTTNTAPASGATTEIRMGHGLAAPGHAVPATGPSEPPVSELTAGRTPSWRRIGLTAAALVSPVALAVQYALNSAGLPRQDAETYLAGVAADSASVSASTGSYAVAMATMVAVGALAAIAMRRSAPIASAVCAALLTLGAIGGGAFVGLRLAALALVEDGQIAPGGVAAFVRLQDGVIDQAGVLLACAILGTFALAVALLRSRRELGWWPGVVTVVGFVLASGEFPTAVSVVGALVQGSALVPLARLALAADR